MAVEVTSLVWQLVEATAQLIKLKKFVTSLVFKKDSAIVCVFYEKQRLNKTGTSQVGAISKAQKPQNIFLEKKLEIFRRKRGPFGDIKKISKKSLTVPKKN